MSRSCRIAVVGATGAVGEAILELIAARHLAVDELFALAAGEDCGGGIEFRGADVRVTDVGAFDFSTVDIALFDGSASLSLAWAAHAAAAGCVVIDPSATFRLEPDVPLVVPGVNDDAIGDYLQRGIVAVPGPATVQMLSVLHPLHREAGVERVNVTACIAVSEDGPDAVAELAEQTRSIFNQRAIECGVYPRQVAFNLLACVDAETMDNGYTRDEMAMILEAQRVLGDGAVAVNATVLRVPVFYGHGLALHVETQGDLDAEQARQVLAATPGVSVPEGAGAAGCPTPVDDAVGSDEVLVGRVRVDVSRPRGLDLWVVADNVRFGTALAGVRIAEALIENHLQ